MSPEAESILKSILSIGSSSDSDSAPAPDADVLIEFCELLAGDPKEELLQLFLERHVGFLTGVFGFRDYSDLAVLFKPPVGTQFKADFCVLQVSQGGAVACIIEIETSHERLFTNRRTPAKRLSSAIGQISDWLGWIDRNSVHYAHELVRMARLLPDIHSYRPGDRGIRFKKPDEIENLWRAFGGFEVPTFRTAIIIGRWSTLDGDEQRRLIDMNRRSNDGPIIYTFEQLARQANARYDRDSL